MSVTGDVLVELGGRINLKKGAPLIHLLSIGGSLVSDGFIVFRRKSNAGDQIIELVFEGAGAGVVAGTSNPIKPAVMRVDKGTGTLTLQLDIEVDDHLDLISGTLDLSGYRLSLVANRYTARAATLDQSGGAITGGDLSYQRRFLGTQGAWRLLAVPASGVPFSALNGTFHTQGAPWARYTDGEAIFFSYGPDTQAYVAETVDGPFGAGAGYFFYVYPTTLGGLPLIPTTWEVTGPEHTSPFQLSLPYNNDDPEQSYALVGNPFAANLDWDAIGGQNGIGLTYTIEDSTGAYVSYQAGGVDTGAGRYIAPMRAFWVQTTATGAFIPFDRALIVDNDGEPTQLGLQAASEPQTLSFNLTRGAEQTVQVARARRPVAVRGPVAVFDGRATLEYDARDVYFPGAAPESGSALWFEQDGRPLAIDSRPADGQHVLDLHVAASEPGTYTLRWAGEALFSEGRPATLTDLETGEQVDMRTVQAHEFVVTVTVPMTMIPAAGPPHPPGFGQVEGSRVSLSAGHRNVRRRNAKPRGVSDIRSLAVESRLGEQNVSGGSPQMVPRFRITVGEAAAVAALAAPRATVEGRRVDLTWSDPAAAESGAAILEYTVEIATDSSAMWLRAGSVQASTESDTYSLVMDDVSYGTHRIRVQRVGFDGMSVASAEVEVHVGVIGTHVLEAVRPNPFQSQATLSLAVAAPQRVRVEVFDLLGRLVAVLYDEDTPADRSTTITLPGAQLATGAYIIRVQGETFADMQKVTVVR